MSRDEIAEVIVTVALFSALAIPAFVTFGWRGIGIVAAVRLLKPQTVVARGR